MPEVHSLLQLLRIERPPLGAANTPSIRQCRWPACTETSQPLASCALTDAVLASQLNKASALVEVLPDQAFPTDGCQAGIGVCMHGL
ncbi:hypothetical protein LBMAG40_05160 [Cyanobium sp.]|nr:hypothetical protein LBMAG40_05160 [Cyanobium sp.]